MNKNLLTRIATGLLAGTVAITGVVLSPLGVWLLCGLVSVLGTWEFLRAANISRRIRRLTLSGVSLFWLIALGERILEDLTGFSSLPFLTVALLIYPLGALLALYQKDLADPMRELGMVALALIYVGLPMYLFYELSVPDLAGDYQFWLPLGVLLLVWTLDSMAYFTGRFLGKRPLFPRISPKKTWEGAIGGAVACMIAGMVLEFYFPPMDHHWVVVAGILAITAQWGDLVESMFKRSVNLKDSGQILPGHGGMLDRFDGLFFAIPFLFLYFQIV